MSEFSPPGLAGDALGNGQEVLTPEAIESILADFRSWLQQAAVSLPPPSAATPQAEPMDLHTLLAQFVALRHEVNLQTKASRVHQEQSAATLEQFSRALAILEQDRSASRQTGEQAQDEALRPLLKTLIDVYDALARAEREVRRLREQILASLDDLGSSVLANDTEPRRPFLTRWFDRRRAAVLDSRLRVALDQRQPVPALTDKIRNLLDSVVTGYAMSVQRIERALEQAGLESIRCSGQAFDPELMEVVALAPDCGRPSGEVVEEVRRGYLWRGRVFRYAQVSVAKP